MIPGQVVYFLKRISRQLDHAVVPDREPRLCNGGKLFEDADSFRCGPDDGFQKGLMSEDLFFRAFAVGDVAGDADDPDDVSLRVAEGDFGCKVSPLGAGRDETFLGDHRFSGFDDKLISATDQLERFRCEELGVIASEDFLDGASDKIAGSLIEEQVLPLEVLDKNGIGGEIHHRSQEFHVSDFGMIPESGVDLWGGRLCGILRFP